MTVQKLIDALGKSKNRGADVDIINTNGDYLAEAEELFTVDEDADGQSVHIVVGYPKL